MKPNVIVALLVGLVLGFAVGKVVTTTGGSTRPDAPTVIATPRAPSESESALAIKSSDLAAETFAGMTDAQKYAAMKVLNDNTCNCGCANDTLAECAKKDPSCPIAPLKVKQAVELAKAGKNAAQIQMDMFGGPAKSAAARAQARPDDTAVFKVPIDGAPVQGKPSALVTMVEFSDYQCPFCSRADSTVEQLEKDYGEKLRVVMRQNPLPMHPNAKGAALAALAAGQQGKYWEMHRKLFSYQQALDEASLEKYARELGLNTAQWKQAKGDPKLEEVIGKDQAMAASLGASGTPAFFINGRRLSGALPIDAFKKLIDEEMGKAEAMVKDGVKPSLVYAKIMEKASSSPPAAGPAPTPPAGAPNAPTAAKKIDVPTDSPTHGPKDAKVTIVEWSDFQCPFCSRAIPTIKQIEESYGKDVRVVFRHQPLPFHNNAKLAAEASMAAHEQGKFWQYHDKLFANQGTLERPSLEKFATELGLDIKRFNGALDSGKFRAKVEADASAGAAVGASGTPTFFVNGRQLIGAQPIEAFKTIIDEELKKGEKPSASAPKKTAKK